MIASFDLRGLDGAGRSRRDRAFRELAVVAEAVPGERLEVVAAGEDAFAARLVVDADTAVTGRPEGELSRRSYRPAGELNRAPVDGPTLLEPVGLPQLADAGQWPAVLDRERERRWQDLAADDRVAWRVAVDWQAAILGLALGVPERRIVRLPAAAGLPDASRLASMRLPRDLPAGYMLCLTPVGRSGDLAALVSAYARLGSDADPLVILGVDDERWLPVARSAVETVGARGRVLLLRDMDPISTIATIARARAVVAIDTHPAHAIRLRQAAALGKPAVVLRHPGHAAWVSGCRWFGNDHGELLAALADPTPMHLARDAPVGSLAGWLKGQRAGERAAKSAS